MSMYFDAQTQLFGQRTKDCVPNVSGVLPFQLARGQSCWTLSEQAIAECSPEGHGFGKLAANKASV